MRGVVRSERIMLRVRYVLCGTELGYRATPAARTVLRLRYAMCGTELWYCATDPLCMLCGTHIVWYTYTQRSVQAGTELWYAPTR
eukprot:377876-Rhodomonas_salina.1